MNTLTCSRCGLVNLATAENCNSCKTPLTDPSPAAIVQPRLNTQNSQSMIIKPNIVAVLDTTCPSCKSNDTQSFSMIYQTGTSVGIISGVGVDGDGGIGIAGGRRVSRTLLAQQVAPPSSPDMYAVLGFVVVTVGAIVVGVGADNIAVLFNFTLLGPLIGFCLAIAFGVIGFKAVYDGYKKGAADYEEHADRWVNSWMCLRCGHSWMPTAKRTAAS